MQVRHHLRNFRYLIVIKVLVRLFVTFSQAKKLLSLGNENKSEFILHFARLFVTLQANYTFYI